MCRKQIINACHFCQRLVWTSECFCHECLICFAELPPKVRWLGELPVYSLFEYEDEVKNIIRMLKGGGSKELSRVLARSLVGKLPFLQTLGVSQVVPAPAKTFGFKDHAFDFAEALAELFQSEVENRRLFRNSDSDQKVKTFSERQLINLSIVSGDFQKQKEGVTFIVDDVLTSGSTLRSCWNILGRPHAIGFVIAAT